MPKWDSAAYTQNPEIRSSQSPTGNVVATAAIECWKGTVEELVLVAETLFEVVGSEGIVIQRIWICWSDGTHEQAKDLIILAERLSSRPASALLSARIEVLSKSLKISGVLVARYKISALSVEINGKSRASVLGATQLIFHKMMIGYVDRMGGWRAPVWMLTAFVPMLLLGTSINEEKTGTLGGFLLVVAIAVGSLTTFKVTYPALLVSKPLELLKELPERHGHIFLKWAVEKYSNPTIKWIVGLMGVMLVGIISNKLSDLIRWP
ncbi:hypothetical protein AB0M44_47370 [Streptosporangium subroseum]|uniref:hypothetical protein n=1 Tax=Streptosporangium subroseum TaxID=106412 RepID=UPI003431AB07